jgi:AcrR family transcriptional regulator
MTKAVANPMTETEEKILDAAIRTFLRYGARKTSMNDIAKAAGVSRQTLYDLFGSKEELIRASTRSITDQKLATVRERLEKSLSLADQLEIYFEETIVESFELLKAAGDAEDLIAGYHEVGKEAIAESHDRHAELVEELLAPYAAQLLSHGLTPQKQAQFFVTVTMGLKAGVETRIELDAVLNTLKKNCLSVVTDKIAMQSH